MKLTKTLAAIALLSACGAEPVSTDFDAYADDAHALERGKPSESTIVETAVALSGTPFEFDSDPSDFDVLVAAVVATGVNESVLDGSDDYTVFAPTDQAFLDLASALSGSDVSDESDAFDIIVDAVGVDGVTGVLAYHVTAGTRGSRSVTRAKQVTMLDGNTISARAGFVEANGSDADFLAVDVRVADGMIHVIDAVLLPF